MSRIYETLRRMEMQRSKPDAVRIESLHPVDLVNTAMTEPAEMEATSTAKIEITLKTRLVALTDPRGLGAEKFRALVTRLENQRKDRDLKSLQVTSAVVNEGKSFGIGKSRRDISEAYRLASAPRGRRSPSSDARSPVWIGPAAKGSVIGGRRGKRKRESRVTSID